MFREKSGPQLTRFVDCLANLYSQEPEHRNINLISLAVSMTHEQIQGQPKGQLPIVSWLLKGGYNARPPKPHYFSMWNVDEVLKKWSLNTAASSPALANNSLGGDRLVGFNKIQKGGWERPNHPNLCKMCQLLGKNTWHSSSSKRNPIDKVVHMASDFTFRKFYYCYVENTLFSSRLLTVDTNEFCHFTILINIFLL